MAVLKQRMNRKNAAGEYDTVHMETSADIVLMPDGTTKLSDKINALEAKIDTRNDNLFAGGFVPNGILVPFAGHQWLVCHSDQNYVYMILNTPSGLVTFGTNNKYAGSTLAGMCTSFLNDINSADQAKLAAITVNGVTSKVFIPSKEHFEGVFTYFDCNEHRKTLVGNAGGATADQYWTSTPYDNSSTVYIITRDGQVSTNASTSSVVKPSDKWGFRPCIAYKR